MRTCSSNEHSIRPVKPTITFLLFSKRTYFESVPAVMGFIAAVYWFSEMPSVKRVGVSSIPPYSHDMSMVPHGLWTQFHREETTSEHATFWAGLLHEMWRCQMTSNTWCHAVNKEWFREWTKWTAHQSQGRGSSTEKCWVNIFWYVSVTSKTIWDMCLWLLGLNDCYKTAVAIHVFDSFVNVFA